MRFGYPHTRTFVLENRGKVLAKFRVVDGNGDEAGVKKPWFHVAPQTGSLVPGRPFQYFVLASMQIDND